jgi:uncharacterized protein (TIGR03546 family)
MFSFNQLAKLLYLLNEGATPNQLASGFVIGFAIGLTPGWPLHLLIILLLLLLFNANISMAIIAAAIATSLAWLIDPWIHQLGLWVLKDIEQLQSLWVVLYNNPVAVMTRFNNSVVMGALVLTLTSAIPLFFLLKYLINKYRNTFAIWISKLGIVRWLKASSFYSIYQKVAE